jgi:hypothetical protein
MSDRQARIAKLRAMAHQTDSPHEAAIAVRRLEAMGEPLDAPASAEVVTVDEAIERGLRDFFRPVPNPVRDEVVIRMDGRTVRRVPGPFGE